MGFWPYSDVGLTQSESLATKPDNLYAGPCQDTGVYASVSLEYGNQDRRRDIGINTFGRIQSTV